MSFTRFILNPVDGFKNTISFPTIPVDETAKRKQIQDIVDQINALANAFEAELEASGGANKIGCVVNGVSMTIQDLIDLIELAGVGSVAPDLSITNSMMATTCKIGSLTNLSALITELSGKRVSLERAIAGVTGLVTVKTQSSTSLSQKTSRQTYAGKIDLFAQSALPAGYLLANGQAVSRSTYVGLFSAIGTTYGAGDGSTTFNVPNLTALSTMQVVIKT